MQRFTKSCTGNVAVCRGKFNLSNLCLTVLGGQGADIVSKAVNKCVKESKSFDKADDSKSKGSPQEEQAAKFGGHHWQGLYPYPGPMFGPGVRISWLWVFPSGQL